MFPELGKREKDIQDILNEEEESFSRTLDRGEKIFQQYAQESIKKGSKILNGADVWRLYDTYGFPVDLTRIMAEEAGLDINEAEFEKAQAEAKEASKANKKSGGVELLKLDVHDLGKLERMKDVPKTDDRYKYDADKGIITSQIKAIYHSREFVDTTKNISTDAQIGILLDKTNFYAEQGGQEYDTGKLIIDGKAEFEVTNVQMYAGYALHTGYMKYGALSVLDEVISEYDELRRWPIRNNHTGTHILNYALRLELGEEVDQKGSLVAAEKLRFDFSHKTQVTVEQLARIEESSTNYIRQNLEVYASDVPLATAKQIEGVRAVFGETYPDPVRVVSIGVPVEDLLSDVRNTKWREVSIEFCGGTHVQKTGDIKDLIILEESGIAKGIRRIVAVTGEDAYRVQEIAAEFSKRLDLLERMAAGPAKEAEIKKTQVDLSNLNISTVTKAKFKERFSKIHKQMMDDLKAKQKAESKKAIDAVTEFFEKNKDSKVMVAKLPISANGKAVGDVLKHMQNKAKDKMVYLFAAENGDEKVVHGCYVPPDLGKHASAQDWAGSVSEVVGGKAGGKGPTTQGVGMNVAKVDEGVEVARKFLEKFQL
jgi:alanyl-tRNA synthetase